ncbi:MAG: (Fe-S)-binding protein [Phycisphaerae bacterium]|nr:(Fe-S)-binding protein [Phycisphaerae bacterium]
MNPYVMTLLLAVGWGAFIFWTAQRRWRLMRVGAPAMRFDHLGKRFALMVRFALGQWRMPRHRLAGVAHIFIYAGAVIMLLRALILFARGYVDDPHFGYWIFTTGPDGAPLGHLYSLLKDILVVLVLVGIGIFFYFRVIKQLPRMTLNFEGMLILAILTGLMLTDALYDGASMARYDHHASGWEPLGSLLAAPLRGASAGTLTFLQHLGFWGHISLILGFMNYLPYCKQFHEITGFPNVFFQDLTLRGRLEPIEDLEGMVEREETLGIARIEQFSWKSILDMYSCTECGRCADACPANRTGKLLSPKQFTVDCRDNLYSRQSELIKKNGEPAKIDLVGEVINPEMVWACTTCRACEQECPVFISYVDKFVDLRRYLVQEKGEFPNDLQLAFRGLENAGNPWGLPAEDRLAWAKGIDVPLISDKPEAEYLWWVGCAPAYDDRAKRVSQAMAKLLNKAGVSYAVLGPEETCTGDTARRAGNEFLFQILAQTNVEILNGYNVKRIITACPHCYNTLRHEYPDFGGHYEVIHHGNFFAQLIREGKLQPTNPVNEQIVFHDSCYLGRYNDIYDPPREVLRTIPGVQLVEAEDSRDRGMCCGAGGAQMFKEEEKGDKRMNILRIEQLLDTKPQTVASACPFCMRMLSDGLGMKDRDDVCQLDIAEVLWKSVQ